MPEYPGRYDEAMVPATIGLAERAALVVYVLTETPDPEYDDELYWIANGCENVIRCRKFAWFVSEEHE